VAIKSEEILVYQLENADTFKKIENLLKEVILSKGVSMVNLLHKIIDLSGQQVKCMSCTSQFAGQSYGLCPKCGSEMMIEYNLKELEEADKEKQEKPPVEEQANQEMQGI